MGVSYRLEGEVAVFVLEGESTVEQAEKAFLAAFGNPDEHQKYLVLIDACASRRNRDLLEVSVVAEALVRYRERIGEKCALVINESREQSMALERRLAGFSMREKVDFGLFFDVESAQKWLVQK